MHRPGVCGGVTHIERSSAESTQKQTFATLPPNRSKNRRTYQRLLILAPAGPPRVSRCRCAREYGAKRDVRRKVAREALLRRVYAWERNRAELALGESLQSASRIAWPSQWRLPRCSSAAATVQRRTGLRAVQRSTARQATQAAAGGAAKNLKAGTIAVVQRRLGCRLILGIKPRPHLRAKCVCVPQANPSSWEAAGAHATHRIVPRRVQLTTRQARPAARAKAKRGGGRISASVRGRSRAVPCR